MVDFNSRDGVQPLEYSFTSSARVMSRAFFLAIGLFVVFLGVQTLGVQRFVLKTREPAAQTTGAGVTEAQPGANKVLEPPPWAPWSLMATGAIVSLYAVTLPAARKA